jgi:integrase
MGFASGTVVLELSVLRAAMNHCVKNGHLTSAPFIQLPPTSRGRERWLTRTEAARLLNASRRFSPHLSLFILIALYTGARRGAILGLRWDQIDFERGRINFNEPGRLITTKRRPIIPIPRQLLWFLRATRRKAGSPWVISYRRGDRVTDVRNSFEKARMEAGIGPDVTAHTLRHTCGTCWLKPASTSIRSPVGSVIRMSGRRSFTLTTIRTTLRLRDARWSGVEVMLDGVTDPKSAVSSRAEDFQPPGHRGGF